MIDNLCGDKAWTKYKRRGVRNNESQNARVVIQEGVVSFSPLDRTKARIHTRYLHHAVSDIFHDYQINADPQKCSKYRYYEWTASAVRWQKTWPLFWITYPELVPLVISCTYVTRYRVIIWVSRKRDSTVFRYFSTLTSYFFRLS